MRRLALEALRACALAALCAGTALASEPAPRTPAPEKPGQLQAQPPPFTQGIFPCTQCHVGPGDRTRRDLGFHEDIKFEHDAEHRWCLDCHDATDRDSLHLASGEKVPFERSYLLCGQCHGEKLRDWRAGVHGRRVGSWNAHKSYLLCAHCHNPHQPHFKPLEPKPAPKPPARLGAAVESAP